MNWFYIAYSGFYKAHFVVLKPNKERKKIVLAQKKKFLFIFPGRDGKAAVWGRGVNLVGGGFLKKKKSKTHTMKVICLIMSIAEPN